jgi:hypothetical protein
MKKTPTTSRWRRLAFIAAAAVVAGTLPALVAPAGPASAMRIDCSYSPGLKAWVDSGHAPGVQCWGGTSAPGGTTGSSGGTSGSSGGASAGVNCQPHQNNLPAGFIESVTRGDSTSFADDFDMRTQDGSSTTRIYEGNRLHGTLQIYRKWKDGKATWVAVYSLFQNGTVSTATFSSGQRCDTGYTYGEPYKAKAPSGTGDIREKLVGPGLPTTPLLGQLETRGSMTQIPGTGDGYFVRIDVTNPAGDDTTSAVIDTGFGDDFDLTSVAATPADTECDIVAQGVEQCIVKHVAPGTTRSLLFAAKAKPSTPADAELPITVSNTGDALTRLEYAPGVSGEFRIHMPVTNLYKLTRPAPVTIAVTPATPVCATESVPGTTALPGTEGDQNDVAGQATKLARHCTNSTGLPMTATAGHGTVTMDGYGWVTYTPEAGHRGADTVSVVTTNPESGAVSAPATFTVNVVAPAEAKDDTYSVVAGTTLATAGSLLDNDRVPPTDGWMIQQGGTPPAHGALTLDTKTGRFTYTPAAGFTGTDSFRYRLSGPDGAASNVVTVTFAVTAN